MLEIQTKDCQPNIAILEIKGRITIGRDCQQLEWAVDNLIREKRQRIIFDLAAVTYIDSTGIGIIVMSSGKVKAAGGELRISGAAGHVEQVLKMTNVDRILGVHPTIAAASESFRI